MNKTLLWVGEKINKESPTNLPDVNELAQYMVKVNWGESALQTFKNRIAEYNHLIHEINCSVGDFVYSDMLISQWGKIKAVNINEGVASFLQAPFNTMHCYLAMLLSEGATIITTNMDLCIEHAYNFFMNETDKMILTEHENGVAIYSGEHGKSGKIYHIHGTAEHTYALGGSIEIGQNYFSKTFRDRLREWMIGDYNLYILGYEFRDIYDVYVYINYQKRQLKNVNWIANVVSTKFRKEQPYHVKGIRKCFKESNLIRKKRSDFCRDLYIKTTNQSQEEVEDKVLYLVEYQKSLKANWKQEVKRVLKSAEEYKDIMLLYVNQSVGVPVDEMDPMIYNRIEVMPEAYKNMYTSLMFRYMHDLIPIYGYNLNENKLNDAERTLFGEELLKLCKDGNNQMNIYIMNLNNIVDKMQEEYLCALRRRTLTDEFEKKAKELLEEIENMLPQEIKGRFLKTPKNNYRDFADLYRLRAGIRAIICDDVRIIKEIDFDLQRAFLYCSQTANRFTMLKTLSYASFCYFCFYYKYGKKSFYDKAQRFKSLGKKQEENKRLGRYCFFDN